MDGLPTMSVWLMVSPSLSLRVRGEGNKPLRVREGKYAPQG